MKIYASAVYVLDGDERTVVSNMFKGVSWDWEEYDEWLEDHTPQEYFDEHA